jgi:hypothetical protein
MSAAPASTAVAGTKVTLTASTSGCPNPLYQFWMAAPGGTWTVVQPYSTNALFAWDTVGAPPGGYSLSVWVRDASASGANGNSDGRWDSYASGTYNITSTPCSSVSLTAAPAAAYAGTNVTFTAAASGCPNPLYQFWLATPAGAWQIVQPYGARSSFTWNTNGAVPGSYSVSVWVRDASSNGSNSNSTGAWDAYSSAQYVLN